MAKIRYIRYTDRKYKVSTEGVVWHKVVEEWVRMIPYLSNGYWYVSIMIRGKWAVRAVHRLVLETFVGRRPKGMECRHYPDRDTANNCLDNLQWGTRSQNQLDRADHGTVPNNKGERNGKAKLSEKKVLRIRSKHASGKYSCSALSKIFGVSYFAIYQIIKRINWKHI